MPRPWDRVLFPDRVSATRKGPDTRDRSGGKVATYDTLFLDRPCSIQPASVETVPDLASQDKQVDVVVIFPEDADLKEGDMLGDIDSAGTPTAPGLRVERYRKLGVFRMARWQAECLGRVV
jgi:hypothetical protein